MKRRSKPVTSYDIMQDVLDLYEGLLIPFMKVRRDLPFPSEHQRPETDSEHAFMLAMVAITISKKMDLNLDAGKIAHYALIHDLVEGYAGDVSARSTDAEQLVKIDREHEAFLVIKKRFAKKVPWIPELIEQYEARADEEARFVYAVDKQMGAYTWLAGKGKGWKKYYPTKASLQFAKVLQRLRKKASLYPDLLDLFDTLHAELDKQRVDFKD